MSILRDVRFAVVAISLTVSCASNAEIVFDNGTYTSTAKGVNYLLLADDFHLTQATNISGGSIFSFGDSNSSGWDSTFDYYVFSDNGGIPGQILASGSGVNVTRTSLGPTGNGYYGDNFKYSFLFKEEFHANANTNYWLGLHLASSYTYSSGANIYWSYSHFRDGIGNAVRSSNGTMDNWTYDEGDRAFYLTGSVVPVPLPSAFWLFGSGMIVLLGRAKLALKGL